MAIQELSILKTGLLRYARNDTKVLGPRFRKDDMYARSELPASGA